METDRLFVHEKPKLKKPTLVLGFSGWMNGGEVSTGTVQYLCNKLDVRLLAEIESEDFYILNFPGTMEITSLFRPHARIEAGMVTDFQVPSNNFYCDEKHDLILFLGKEPNLRWLEYSECLFDLASRFGVSSIYFIGSVGGAVPHTRQPRMLASVSHEKLKPDLSKLGIHFSNYEGPAGISTYLTQDAADHDIPMIVLVAEIPPYVQGKNPRCIEAMVKLLGGILDVHVEHEDLQKMGDDLERRLNEALADHPELLDRIKSLEDNYDREIFDDKMDDMKHWLTERGIRLD
jgi:proteasome assembly chaperone (PAC2) family protein